VCLRSEEDFYSVTLQVENKKTIYESLQVRCLSLFDSILPLI
jgi:hypothetical protein